MDNRVAGRKISALRQARSLTQQQLAAMMNVSHQAVSKWESGLALPDISTMLELTRFFGITVEQLFEEESIHSDAAAEAVCEETTEPAAEKEAKYMNIQQLLQMAPFMSKEAVDEIALQISDPISAQQMAKLAPFVSQESLNMLIERHKPQFSWDSLKKLAPFMSRDAVDALARAIAAGEENVSAPEDNIGKTFNDLGKAFDSFGKDVGQAFDGLGRKAKKGVKKAIRFGGKVINEVSSAISELGDDPLEAKPAAQRSERALAIRKKAFERAAEDNRWDWIAAHIEEIKDDDELKAKIAARAKSLDMHDWICEHMGGYADESTIRAAVSGGNWDWLGENAWLFDPEMQQKAALAAMKAENWKWLEDHCDQLDLKCCGFEIALSALRAGERELCTQLTRNQLTQPEAVALANEAYAAGDFDALAMLMPSAGKDYGKRLMLELAENGKWDQALAFAAAADADVIERLMETAVDQGNFDAVDCLDALL